MVEIRPFKGIYFNKNKIDKIEEVITPPYDIISPGAQERFYQRHPYNIIRIVLGKTYPKDTENSNCYTRAKEYYDDLMDKEVLVQNKQPALFVYQQEFSVNSKKLRRLGLIGRIHIEEYQKRIILPHEATLKKPKLDRFLLIKNTHLNLCPIFGLYEDPELTINKILKKITLSEPMMTFTDEYQITHTLWKTEISSEIEEIQKLLADRRVLIADGHHRYEVAIQFKKYLSDFLKNPPDSINYTLFCLTGMEDKGLVVFPIHRLIRNLSRTQKQRLLEKLPEDFDIERFPAQQIEETLSQKGQKSTSFWVFFADSPEVLIITLKKSEAGEDTLDSLDVSRLHNLIFKNLLHFGPENNEDNIQYTKDTEKVLQGVKSGLWAAGFLLNPTKIEQVKEVAFSGQLMPQKSTYFFPKLISGLVINNIS